MRIPPYDSTRHTILDLDRAVAARFDMDADRAFRRFGASVIARTDSNGGLHIVRVRTPFARGGGSSSGIPTAEAASLRE